MVMYVIILCVLHGIEVFHVEWIVKEVEVESDEKTFTAPYIVAVWKAHLLQGKLS